MNLGNKPVNLVRSTLKVYYKPIETDVPLIERSMAINEDGGDT